MHFHIAPILVAFASAHAFAGGFHALSLPGSQLAALSADGKVAAGGLAGGASGGFRWREGEPAETLVGAMSVRAISASGRYLAGSSLDKHGIEVATWWSADGAAHAIGGLADSDARAGVLSIAYGITDDLKVVGTATDARHASVAFSWTPAAGIEVLDRQAGASGATGISRDGHRVFGWHGRADIKREGVLWCDDWPSRRHVASGNWSDLLGANRDATVIFGIEQDAAGHEVPFAWTPDRAPPRSSFPAIDRGTPLRLVASSDDGAIAAGSIGNGAQRTAVVWTSTAGIEHLDAYAQRHGVDIPEGWKLVAATALSSDGRHVGGHGLRDGRFDSFVIELPHPPERALAHPGTASPRRPSTGELP